MSIFTRLREGLARTTQQIVERFDDIVRRADTPERRSRPVDVETVDALEELLISADIGMSATDRIIAAVKKASRSGESLRDLVKAEIRRVFELSASEDGHDDPWWNYHVSHARDADELYEDLIRPFVSSPGR